MAHFSNLSTPAPASLALLVPLGLVLGAVVGSFLAAALLRWPQGRSVVRGRSQCDSCGKPLGIAELVPLLSWAVLRGRCRQCQARIDPRHPAIEAAGALIGLVAILAHPLPAALATALLGWWLLLIAALDAEHHWLPDRLTLPLVGAGLAIGWAGIGPPLVDRLIGAAAGYGLLQALRYAYRGLRGREGLGGGDPKLFAALGAWLGWQALPFVMLGAGLLGLTAVALRMARGERVAAADRLPLGTLLALAAWPVWLLIGR